MQNILTVYKFDLPFIERYAEFSVFKSINETLREELHYLWLTKQIFWKESYKYNIMDIYELKNWEINVIFLKERTDYFLPWIEINLYVDNKITEKDKNNIIKSIIKSIEWLWLDNYIFDFAEKNTFIKEYDLITVDILKKKFLNFSLKKIKDFLLSADLNYLEYQLSYNRDIKYSFYYLIYILYIFYENNTKILEQNDYIQNIWRKDIKLEFKNNIEYSRIKLNHLHNLNLNIFKKYKTMLDNFFKIFNWQ